MSDARAVIVNQITESEWQGWVELTARTFGWRPYHTRRSEGSNAGFPDLVLVRGEELVFAELKNERGKVTAAQQEWLDDLARVPAVEVVVWRPSQQDDVIERLRPAPHTAGRENGSQTGTHAA
jgi:hypothetical protein